MSKDINTFKGHIDKYLKNRAEDYTSQRLTPFIVISSTAATVLKRRIKVNQGESSASMNRVDLGPSRSRPTSISAHVDFGPPV